jgi:hypothetical protein
VAYKIVATYKGETFSFIAKEKVRWLRFRRNIAAIVLSKNTAHFKRALDVAVLYNIHIIGHEAIHIYQARKLGWKYLPVYLWNWAKAGFKYRENIMEQEAFQNEHLVDWHIEFEIKI